MILNFFGILLWPRYWNGSESEWNTSPSFIMKHLWIKNAKNPVKKETWKSKQSALDGAKRTQIHSSPFDVPVFQVVHWVLVAHPIWHLYLISLAYNGHKSLAHYHHFLKIIWFLSASGALAVSHYRIIVDFVHLQGLRHIRVHHLVRVALGNIILRHVATLQIITGKNQLSELVKIS